MSFLDNYDFFIEQLLKSALEDYKQTAEYISSCEKLEQMEEYCKNELTECQRVFVFECFNILEIVYKQQEYYIYKKGLSDSIDILKQMKILA